MEEEVVNVKVAFIGNSGSGKTCLINRYINQTFNPYQDPTIGATYFSKMITSKVKPFRLSIWDTAGQDKYNSISSLYCKHSDAFIIVCDLLIPNPDLSVSKWYNKAVRENKREDVPVFIVINKIDLFSQELAPVIRRVEEFADSLQIPIFKVSSKDDLNIKELFEKLLKAITNTKSTFSRTSLTLSSGKHSQKVFEHRRKKCC